VLVEAEADPRLNTNAEVVAHQPCIDKGIMVLVRQVRLLVCFFWVILKGIESQFLIDHIFDLEFLFLILVGNDRVRKLNGRLMHGKGVTDGVPLHFLSIPHLYVSNIVHIAL
jgi:hypothetical protein